MNLKGRLHLLEGKAGLVDQHDNVLQVTRGTARKIAFVLQRGLDEPAGPAAQAAIKIARLLTLREKLA